VWNFGEDYPLLTVWIDILRSRTGHYIDEYGASMLGPGSLQPLIDSVDEGIRRTQDPTATMILREFREVAVEAQERGEGLWFLGD
jgi:hypothetical protein